MCVNLKKEYLQGVPKITPTGETAEEILPYLDLATLAYLHILLAHERWHGAVSDVEEAVLVSFEVLSVPSDSQGRHYGIHPRVGADEHICFCHYLQIGKIFENQLAQRRLLQLHQGSEGR